MKCEIITFKKKYTLPLFELIHQTLKEEYSEFYTSDAIDYFLSYNQPCDILNDAKTGYISLCFIDNKLVGSGGLVNNNVRKMFVLSEYQRMGVGTLILKHLENKAIENSLDFIELYAMMPSVGFYKTLGYNELIQCKYKTYGNNFVDYIRMAKSLKMPSYNILPDLNRKRFIFSSSKYPFLNGKEVLFFLRNNIIMSVFPERREFNEEMIGTVENSFLFLNYLFIENNEELRGWCKCISGKTYNEKLRFTGYDNNNNPLFILDEAPSF